jgi:hypothetical protein
MSEPSDKQLYERVKKQIYAKYPEHSAYRSGLLVKEYKKTFSKIHPNEKPYIGKKQSKEGFNGVESRIEGLSRWFAEEWTNQRGDIGYQKKGDVYRPNIRISEQTPLTFSELSKTDIAKAQKQKKRTGRVKRF